MRAPRPAAKVVRLSLAAIAVAWSVAPIALIVLASFKPPLEIFAIPPRFIFTPTLENYQRLWVAWPAFLPNMLNSLIVTAGATLVTVSTALLAGYVYARFSSRFLTASAFFMIVVRMMPPIIVTLPLFPVINWLRLNDTHLVLMLFYSAFFVSISTWILRAFIDQIPRELEEAAFVDGASLRQILLRVVLPLVTNGLVAASIFVIVFAWNEYFFALIFTTREARTTPLVIAEILSTVEGVDWGILFAAASAQLAPILVFVIAVQRYVIAGLTASAVKG
jgi:multiple sugar transport system permease protein